MLKTAGDITIFGAALILGLTIFYYGIWVRWEKTREGRHVMVWTAACFAMMAYWSYRVIWAASNAPLGVESQVFRFLIAATFLVLGAQRFALIWQAQHNANRLLL